MSQTILQQPSIQEPLNQSGVNSLSFNCNKFQPKEIRPSVQQGQIKIQLNSDQLINKCTQQLNLKPMKDDEFVDPMKQQAKQTDNKKYDLKKHLSFEIKALNKIQRSSSIKDQYS